MSHLSDVRNLPCVVCHVLGVSQITNTEAHHPRFAAGMAQKSSDRLAIAVCVEHHRGKSGIHGDRSAWNIKKLDEPQALAITIDWLLGGRAANGEF